MSEPTRTVWNCVECSNALHIRPNSNYVSCHICGASFRLHWRGGQIVDHISLKNIKNVLDDNTTSEDVEQNLTVSRRDLQVLNSKIRRIEMSKSGERFKVFSLFLLICTAIYALFRFTVDGIRSLDALTMTDLYVLAAAGFAFIVFVISGIYKSATVRKVNRLIAERDELEKQMLDSEASLHIIANRRSRAHPGDDDATLPQSETAPPSDLQEEREPAEVEPDEEHSAEAPPAETDDSGNIIKNYADRKKQKRRRLSIRDEDE